MQRPALTNLSNCGSNSSLVRDCSGHGTCRTSNGTDGWCQCQLGYDRVVACSEPFFHSIDNSVQVGLIMLAWMAYGLMTVLFALEIIHHVCKGSLRRGRFSAWPGIGSLLFLLSRLLSFSLLGIDFINRTGRLQSTIWIINSIGVTILGVAVVLCITEWLDLIERAKSLDQLSTSFRRCKTTSLVFLGIFTPLAIITSIISALGVMPEFFSLISQFFSALAMIVPLIIAIVCLIIALPFVKTLRAKEKQKQTQIVWQKTVTLAIVILSIFVTFGWMFVAAAFDQEVSGVVMLKYYMYVVTDMLILPVLYWFTQKYVLRPNRPLCYNYSTFRTLRVTNEASNTRTPSSSTAGSVTSTQPVTSTQKETQ